MDPKVAIAEFNDKLLLPLYAEIQSSSRMKSKGRALAVYPIEQATRKDLVNHALDSISGFDVYAYQPTRPF